MAPRYFVQPYQRRRGGLARADLIACDEEDRAFRIGRGMQHRVAGLAFFKIETGVLGDEWTEVEVLCTVGDVPSDEAA